MTTIINEQLLDEVTRRAQNSPRLRMNYNFHHSLDERKFTVKAVLQHS